MIQLACYGCTTGTVVHHNNNTLSTSIVINPGDYPLLVSQQPGSSRPLDAAIHTSATVYPTTLARAILEKLATTSNNKQVSLHPSDSELQHILSRQAVSVQPRSQLPADDLRACVTAIYLCVIIANSSWPSCNLLESLCNQYIQTYNPRDSDADTSYLNPTSLEAAIQELVAFTGGGRKSDERDEILEIERRRQKPQLKSAARSAVVGSVGSKLKDGSKTHLENHLEHNKTNKQTGDALGRLKLSSKLARRRYYPRNSAIDGDNPGQEQSQFAGWLPRLLRSFNWDTLWIGSSEPADDEEMLSDQPQSSSDATDAPEREKFQILRPVDRNEHRNEINQTSGTFKLEQSSSMGLFANQPNSMNQDEDSEPLSGVQNPSLLEVKTGQEMAALEGLSKILGANKEFDLSSSINLDSSVQGTRQQSLIPDKPQQQVLIPMRNECRCPARPSDELPSECRFNKCFPTTDSSDLKNDATLGQSSLVKSPLEVSFLHYTRYQRRAQFLDLSNDSSLEIQSVSFELFNVSLPVKVVIHGFGSGGRKSWVQEMVFKILDYEDVNVIVVDWEKGAAMPHYVQAAGNTKLVGQRLAQLIQSLNTRFGLTGNNYHLIGFSLGAHVAGFAGAEIRNSTPSGASQYWINRITGLDPASLLFEGYEPSERLDPTDAQFVDIIHSNGDGVLRGGFGAIQELGHVDFYPNGGRVQVGCNSVLLSALSDIIYGKWQSLCNHRRALNFFMDSFEYSKCRFKSFNCDSYESYLRGDCFDCGQNNEKCSYMGYFADLSLGRGKMYLTTHEEAPFCANQFLIKIIGTRGYRSHWGKVEVTLKTFDGKNESFWLSSSAVKDAATNGVDGPSSSQHNMQSLVVAHSPLANFTQVLLRYTRYKGWIYNGNESWSIDKLLITDSDGLIKSYCGYGTILQSHIISYVDLEPSNCSFQQELAPEPTSSTFSPSKNNSQQKTAVQVTGMLPPSNQDVQSRQSATAVVQPLLAKPQQEPALTSPTTHQTHPSSKLSVGYFPDRWQQQHRMRQQQVTSFVSQFTTNNNMLQIKAI